NVNYDPTKYPERWNNFKNYTYNQINELTSEYGKVDILWLDGGWVRPFSTIDQSVDWQRGIKVEQDIDMDRIGGMARKNQPGIIVVDRTVPGKWENYVTPEQAVPEHPLDIPWESCITMGNSFSYVPNDQYKSTKKIVETLGKIISLVGNYFMNIAPGPHGDLDQAAYDRLKELAKWVQINESAIYATRSIAPYHENEYYYPRSKDNKTINVFHLSEGEKYSAPATFSFQVPANSKIKGVKILGHNGKAKWTLKENILTVQNSAKNLDYATAIQVSLK